MDYKSKMEINDALSASTLAYSKNGDQTICVVTKEWDLAQEVWKMEDTASQIIRSGDVKFSVKSNKAMGRKYIHTTDTGKFILDSLKVPISEIRKHFPMHQFNPFVELFIKEMEKRNLYELPCIIKCLSDDEVVLSVDGLNGAIAAIRQEGKSAKFKNIMSNFQRTMNKNYGELIQYIDALFDQFARLLVIRLDLGYLKKHCWPCDVESAVTFDDVKTHWGNMLKYLSTKLPDDCLAGFAYRVEYGLEKNFHIHAMIFLDGSKVLEDVTIARLIGEHWESIITEGKGLCWNCKANKNSYKSLGIGMINHFDAELRENLKKAAIYLTKIDFYIKLVTPGNWRTFGKGNMPKQKNSKQGRPRKNAKPRTKSKPRQNSVSPT